MAASANAKISWDLLPTGTPDADWTLTQYWSFDSAGTGGDPNYHALGDSPLNTAWPGFLSQCFEITTYPGQYTANPDTRIWVRDPQTLVWKSVNDDISPGVWQSHARIWIAGINSTMSFGIRVAAYNLAHNTDEFKITITRLAISEADCTTNQSIPWAKLTGQGVTFSLVLSSNAG